MEWMLLFLCAAALIGLIACGPGEQQSQGFRLPDGDRAKGQAEFVELKCHTCHTVAGVELPPADSQGQHSVPLGGEVVKVKTYGELVTAIINPAHDICTSFDMTKVTDGQMSPMPEYNHVMTVAEMTDLAAFLHSSYQKLQPDYSGYNYPYLQ